MSMQLLVIVLLYGYVHVTDAHIACNCSVASKSSIINTTRMLCARFPSCASAFGATLDSPPDAVSFAFAFYGSTAARHLRLMDAAQTCLGFECSTIFTEIWMVLASDGIRCESTHTFDPALDACVCTSSSCRRASAAPTALSTSRPYDAMMIYVVLVVLVGAFVLHVSFVQRKLVHALSVANRTRKPKEK